MAEILGTVVGVVSLGLQVCSGLTKYLDGIQCQKDDVAATARHCQSTQTFLSQLASYKDRITTVTGTEEAFASLAQAMTSADTELRLIRDFVDKLCGKAVPSGFSSSTFDKVQKKLRYPFRRDHLEILDGRLAKANEALQTALQVVEMELSFKNNDTLQRIQVDGTAARTEISSKLDDLQRVSIQGKDSLCDISQGMTSLSLEVRAFAPRALAHMEASHAAILDVQKRLNHIYSSRGPPPRRSVPEVIEVLETLESSDTRVLLQRLLSKPEALRIACEYAESSTQTTAAGRFGGLREDGDENSDSTIGTYARLLKCRCNPRRRLKKTIRTFGPVFLTQGAVTPWAHSHSCPHAAWNDEQSFWSVGLSTTIFKKILSTAVTVTLMSSTGAGGCGMSPEHVRYRPIHPDSPAFKIIHVWSTYSSFFKRFNGEVLDTTLKSLQWLFTQKKASPFDLDVGGRTLLHRVFMKGLCSGNHHELISLVEFLVAAGVPNSVSFSLKNYYVALSPILPLHQYLRLSLDDSHLFRRMLRLLWPGENALEEAKSIASPLGFGLSLLSLDNSVLPNNSLFPRTRWLGSCLHAAIGEKNMKALVDLLDQNTELDWSESDIFGFTALQQLTFWIEGLRLVLSRLGRSILQTHDRQFYSLLQCAFFWSRRLCHEASGRVRCSTSCPCDEPTGLLLKNQCSIDFSKRLLDYLPQASVRCQETFISHLETRRSKLRDLALVHLAPEQIDQLGLSKSAALDLQTSTIIHELKRRSVEIPPELLTSTTFPNSMFPITNISNRFIDTEFEVKTPVSIYHILTQSPYFDDDDKISALAASFYAKGFEDVDSKASSGITPLMLATDMAFFNSNFCWWLLEHGADPFLQLPNRVLGYTVAHEICRSYAKPLLSGRLKGFSEISGFCRNADSCRCSCSPYGCRPLTMLWKNGGWDAARGFCCVSWYEEEFGFTPEVELMIFRMATFETLNLRHTCCNRGRVEIEKDDREEIWDEDSETLRQLEGLVAEHQETLSSSQCSMSSFFNNQWKARMQQVTQELLEERYALSREEREAIIEMGVVIDYENSEDGGKDRESSDDVAEDEDRESSDGESEYEDRESSYEEAESGPCAVAYWTNQIDDVMSLVRAGQWPPQDELL